MSWVFARLVAPTRMAVPAALVAILATAPADAQVWGRRGFTWQPEIQLARDELARLQADLDRLSREAWNARSLAWLEVGPPAEEDSGSRPLRVTASWRVGDLMFKKKARVRALDGEDGPSQWEVDFDGRPQPRVAVVMTDVDSTRVVCPVWEVRDEGGALGVFQHQGVLLCLARQPERGPPG